MESIEGNNDLAEHQSTHVSIDTIEINWERWIAQKVKSEEDNINSLEGKLKASKKRMKDVSHLQLDFSRDFIQAVESTKEKVDKACKNDHEMQ